MNSSRSIAAVIVAIAASLLVAGCYTQPGTVREEGESPTAADNPTQYDTSAADSSAYSDESYDGARRHFYYDYYYPPVSVGVGFYDAWWYGYYSPWSVGVYWGWPYWGGYYGGYYPYSPYYPYYPYYGYGYYGGYYPYYGGSYAVRTFGSTRGGGTTRGGYASYPSRLTPSGATGVRTSARTAGQGVGRSVPAVRTPSGSTRLAPSATKRGGSRTGVRSTQPRSRLSSPPARSGGRSYPSPSVRGGGNYGGGRSYAPPSGGRSGGGSRGGSSGSRGGGGRR